MNTKKKTALTLMRLERANDSLLEIYNRLAADPAGSPLSKDVAIIASSVRLLINIGIDQKQS